MTDNLNLTYLSTICFRFTGSTSFLNLSKPKWPYFLGFKKIEDGKVEEPDKDVGAGGLLQTKQIPIKIIAKCLLVV